MSNEQAKISRMTTKKNLNTTQKKKKKKMSFGKKLTINKLIPMQNIHDCEEFK